MKINLGSNNVLHEGFKNVDIRDIPEVDIVDDFTKLEKIADNSVEHMICHNMESLYSTDTRRIIIGKN
jgi:predicted SAM-dependent methyltransferase